MIKPHIYAYIHLKEGIQYFYRMLTLPHTTVRIILEGRITITQNRISGEKRSFYIDLSATWMIGTKETLKIRMDLMDLMDLWSVVYADPEPQLDALGIDQIDSLGGNSQP
ncbi:hypothetical protein AGABI1DRAFT_91156 [Agaricus bisporus var. burnettii JB137-S8]|uniref:Uncharacterized protein n=1 Tax=Agaricus bisporus var. burnettii (strain JB137-S8 / ATCC MYA-4627 / FGSC 10392) TaxID=597362 RepID=K5X988_AGABU|nr:uncharacterized protein AGABI1DRAFT_91156 [Agaricus bisporus var. burnettii JB137-S8]EKM79783.1 hypothetical protein AGABI1DRAFT_91156 [Agaricus bisporus var. burnettii JB137-S8]